MTLQCSLLPSAYAQAFPEPSYQIPGRKTRTNPGLQFGPRFPIIACRKAYWQYPFDLHIERDTYDVKPHNP